MVKEVASISYTLRLKEIHIKDRNWITTQLCYVGHSYGEVPYLFDSGISGTLSGGYFGCEAGHICV